MKILKNEKVKRNKELKYQNTDKNGSILRRLYVNLPGWCFMRKFTTSENTIYIQIQVRTKEFQII